MVMIETVLKDESNNYNYGKYHNMNMSTREFIAFWEKGNQPHKIMTYWIIDDTYYPFFGKVIMLMGYSLPLHIIKYIHFIGYMNLCYFIHDSSSDNIENANVTFVDVNNFPEQSKNINNFLKSHCKKNYKRIRVCENVICGQKCIMEWIYLDGKIVLIEDVYTSPQKGFFLKLFLSALGLSNYFTLIMTIIIVISFYFKITSFNKPF